MKEAGKEGRLMQTCYNSILREIEPSYQSIPEPNLPVGGFPCSYRLGLQSIPAAVNHKLGAVHGKLGFSANPLKNFKVQQLVVWRDSVS